MVAETSYFGPGLFEFLKDLKANNRKEWFLANKDRYEAEVRQPMLRFIVIALGMAAIFTTGVLWGGPALYRVMGGTGGTLEAALAYSNVVFAGTLAFWLLHTLGSIVRGTGHMFLPAALFVAGGGWIAIHWFEGGLQALFAAIAVALVVYGTTVAMAIKAGAWR